MKTLLTTPPTLYTGCGNWAKASYRIIVNWESAGKPVDDNPTFRDVGSPVAAHHHPRKERVIICHDRGLARQAYIARLCAIINAGSA
jgi:hypothetical protein